MTEALSHASQAARDGRLDTLRTILSDSPGVLTATDSDGWTPLHTAGMAGHTDLGARLVKAGAAVDAQAYGKAGGSALSYALFYAKAYMGDVLRPTHPDNLRAAAALGTDIGRFVDGDDLKPQAYAGLDFYAPVFFPVWERTKSRQEVLDEALSWASRNNQCESMAALVEIGANVDANPFRGTPLLWACYSDKVDAARWLLDHGADPDLRHDWGGDGHGVSAVAMHLAAQHGPRVPGIAPRPWRGPDDRRCRPRWRPPRLGRIQRGRRSGRDSPSTARLTRSKAMSQQRSEEVMRRYLTGVTSFHTHDVLR